MTDHSERSLSHTAHSRDGDATVLVGADTRSTRTSAAPIPQGSKLGRFVVIEEVGAGGMGRVLRAYDPKLAREVALKLMHTADEKATERMLREAQAMAQLSHPNVLPIYDVGEHDSGLFIAMEFVEGKTVRQWCEDDRPGWREVVRVFVDAGRGLAAAHRAGLVHRDFKPDNVLVDAEHRVRVMDFGLARATDHNAPLSDFEIASGSRSLLESVSNPLTEAGTVLGTPAYMAPEQHRDGSGDHRSDQYAYCVALFEALHGRRPFAGENLVALVRAKEQLRLRQLPTGGAPVVPRWLHRAILRGLRPAPAERWPSIDALLAELDRGLTRSWRKTTLVVGTGIAVVAAFVAHARYRSQLCSGAREQLAEIWDEPRAASLEAVFLATAAANAADAWSRTRDGLDAYASRWTASHIEACEATRMRGDQSREMMDARMRCLQGRRRELSALIDTLAKADAAVVQKAVEAVTSLSPVDRCDDMAYVMAQVPPPDDPALEARVDDLRAQLAEARALHAAGRYAEGLPIAQAIAEEAEALGYLPLVAEAFRRLGALEEGTGAYESAVDSLERAYFDALRSGMDELAAEAASALVFCLGHGLNRHDDALVWAAHARAEVDRAGTDEMLASLLNSIAVVQYHRGAYTQSKALHEEALALQERALGPDHTDIAATLSGLGNVHHALGSIDEAIRLFERSLALREQAVGTDHPSVAVAISNLGLAMRAKGSFDEAIRLQERALDMRERLLGPEHPEVAASLSNLAGAHFSSGQHERAAELFEQALAVREKTFGRDHPKVAEMLNNLAATHATRGDHETAGALHRRALRIWEATQGPDHPRVAMSLNNLGNVASKLGDPDEAEHLYQRSIDILERVFGPDHLHLSYPLVSLGDVWLTHGRVREAIPLLERGLAIREARGAIPVELAGARFSLARALWDAPPSNGRDRERALQLATQARAGLEASAPEDSLNAEIGTWLARTNPRH